MDADLLAALAADVETFQNEQRREIQEQRSRWNANLAVSRRRLDAFARNSDPNCGWMNSSKQVLEFKRRLEQATGNEEQILKLVHELRERRSNLTNAALDSFNEATKNIFGATAN